MATGFMSRWTSSCSRAISRFIKARSETGWNTSSRFNDYNRVIHAEDDSDASYSIGGTSLEFDVVTQPELARMVRNQYTGQIAIPV